MESIVLSYNVRGLESMVKHRAIREMVAREKFELLMIRETKLPEVDQRMCS